MANERASNLSYPQPQLPKRYRRIATTLTDQHRCATPAYTPDDAGGYYIILENYQVCKTCGGTARHRAAYICSQTNLEAVNQDLTTHKLGFGAIARFYFTECQDCGEGKYA